VNGDPDFRSISTKPAPLIPADDLPPAFLQLVSTPAAFQTERDGIQTSRIEQSGTIQTESGFLACADCGDWTTGLSVFNRQVPIGEFPLRLVFGSLFGCVEAAIIQFAPPDPNDTVIAATRLLPSSWPQEETHIISVDGGMIGLADANAISTLSESERDALWQNLANASLDNPCSSISIPRSHLSVVGISSGMGDGGYAAFWRLRPTGQPAALMFDFAATLATAVWKQINVPFTLPALQDGRDQQTFTVEGVSFRFFRRSGASEFVITRRASISAQIRDEAGTLLFDSEGAGCSVCGDETTYVLPSNFSRRLKGSITAKQYLGHRYILDQS
jgi:hypothetical protein